MGTKGIAEQVAEQAPDYATSRTGFDWVDQKTGTSPEDRLPRLIQL